MTDSSRHVPLARKYRPTRFTGERGIIGQPHVAQTLQNAVQAGQLANAYLLAGPRGTGKTTAARILAAALNCPHGEAGQPCGECSTCEAIIAGRESHDVIEIDAASNRGVDDARELREQAQYAPSTEDAHKVYILDEAHMMTREAWNALLKVIEEPPARVLFVFCTTEPEKIEQTAEPIISRCQRLDMRRLTVRDITDHLLSVCKQEGIEAQESALILLARRADGAMRDALSTVDQLRAFQGEGELTAEAVRDAFGMQPETVYLSVLDIIANHARGRVFKLVQYLNEQGADFVQFMDEYQRTLSDLAMAQEGGRPEGWSQKALAGLMKRAGRSWEAGEWVQAESPLVPIRQLVDLMGIAQEDSRAIRRAPRPETVFLTTLQRSITLLEEGRS